MLSFDITDRNIKIVSGNEKGGKIKIDSCVNLDLAEGIIENGIAKDITTLASRINEVLKESKMKTNDAVISISSNLIIFKEMNVPKVKRPQLKTMVQNKLALMINVFEEQNVGFTVGSNDDKKIDSENTLKILATSCPKSIVESYKKVFSMLKISLKDISVSCNSINKLIAKDKELIKIMPILLVQIDPTFININIFENGQLAFSRFATISPENYDDRSDYIFHAVNENIYRVLQFQDSRSRETIGNVIFYGDTTLFTRLQNELNKMGVSSSLLNSNNSFSGCDNAKFTVYANAIGALIKGNKTVDLTNLLEVDVGTTKQLDVSASSLGMQIGGSFLVGAIIITIVFTRFNSINNAIETDINSIDNYINSPDTISKIIEHDSLEANISKLTEYKTSIGTVTDCINSQPVIRSEVFNQVREAFDKSPFELVDLGFNEGTLWENYFVSDQTIPAKMVTNIINGTNNFCGVDYNGYTLDSTKQMFNSNISLTIRGEADLGKTTKITTSENASKNGGAK